MFPAFDVNNATVSTYHPGDPDYAEDILYLGMEPEDGLHAVAIGCGDPAVVLTAESVEELVKVFTEALAKLGHS